MKFLRGFVTIAVQLTVFMFSLNSVEFSIGSTKLLSTPITENFCLFLSLSRLEREREKVCVIEGRTPSLKNRLIRYSLQ